MASSRNCRTSASHPPCPYPQHGESCWRAASWDTRGDAAWSMKRSSAGSSCWSSCLLAVRYLLRLTFAAAAWPSAHVGDRDGDGTEEIRKRCEDQNTRTRFTANKSKHVRLILLSSHSSRVSRSRHQSTIRNAQTEVQVVSDRARM